MDLPLLRFFGKSEKGFAKLFSRAAVCCTPIVRTQSNMANRQRALTLLVLLFEELFDITAERELQELSDDETEDLLLLVLLGNHGFPVNRVRVVGYFEVVVPSYRLDDFRSHFRMSRDSVSFIEGLLGVCPEIPHQAHGHGGKAPVELRKQILITVWILANPECLRSVSDHLTFLVQRAMKSTSEYVQRLWTTWYIDLFISQRETMQGTLFKSLKNNEDFLGC